MSKTIGIKSDRIIAQNGFFSGYLYIENGKIKMLSKERLPADTEFDYTGLIVSPGFIDMHTHGAGGYAFLESSAEAVTAGCDFHLKHGTTAILPTVSAAPFEVMKSATHNIAEAIKSGKAKTNILGAHLEGPYLSAAQCGAQCPDFITEPKKEEYEALINQYGKYIKRWSYAPENDKNGSFCKFLSDNNILPSAGHTDAKYSDMLIASENGCKLITHLYSCTSTVTRDKGFRSLGVIETAFLRDDVFVEIIADGRHLPKELVQMIIKIKGTDKVALITDSMDIAGTDITEGIMGKTEFIVEDGVCKLKDRSAFAGSVATADRLIRFMTAECGYQIPEAVKMITSVPANILNLKKGSLKPGFDSDIAVFDDDIKIKDVFVNGETAVCN